ncbi:hypothetical protein VPH35_013421 [Triticum aestivum]|uniref:DUF6598 domain-containing protein n=1 Tax=Triticum aestivum TaxID=4565 RepID=A0A3B5ZRQ0_WHEAT
MADGGSSPVAAAARKWEWDQEEYRCEPAEYSVDPRYSEYDPKQGCFICVRYFFDGKLDLDEESPAGPMRHTGKIFREGFPLANSVNVVSIKIVSSDYGYPLNVYAPAGPMQHTGKTFKEAFRLKNSVNVVSINIVSSDYGYPLNVYGEGCAWEDCDDDRLSKGLMEVDAISRLEYSPRYVVDTETLVSMHSILDLNYTFVRRSVEATVEIRILEGPDEFHGKIVASTTSIPCDIVLHDSKVSGALTAGDDELSVVTIEFTPRRNGYDDGSITCGDYKMLLKVTWAIM